MSGEEYDEQTIVLARLATRGRSGPAILLFLWRSLLEGAAMYGAAMHGWPSPDDFRSDITRQEDSE